MQLFPWNISALIVDPDLPLDLPVFSAIIYGLNNYENLDSQVDLLDRPETQLWYSFWVPPQAHNTLCT